jgi:ABC-type oligopeptide transport system substrate-binding subunit
MRRTVSRLARLAAAVALIGGAMAVPGHVAGADDRVLRVGTVQDLDSMNPWNTALETGFEVFTLNYQLLVGFGPNLEPIPGYAASWSKTGAECGTTSAAATALASPPAAGTT